MKTLFIFISVFLIAFTPGKDSDVPFKKCNTIKIVPPENDTTMLKKFASLLEEKGLVIQSFNEDIDNLKTEWFIMKGNVNTKSQIFARYDRIKEQHVFYVTAYYMYSLQIDAETTKYKMSYKNPNFSTDGALFEYIDKLCTAFSAQYGYQMYYLKR